MPGGDVPGTTLAPARATFIRPSPDACSRVHLTNWPIRPPPGYPRHRLLAALLILAFIVGAGSTFIFISGPAQAQVAYDTAVESVRTLTTDPYTWSHSPVGTPRAVIVTVAHGIESTDCIVSVSYGSASMTRVTTAADTATEPGRAYAYFVGASIPTGAQTISADIAATGACSTTDMEFTSVTYTATVNTEVLASATDAENQANPTATLAYSGRVGLAVMVFYSGLASSGLPLTSACSGSSACSLVFNEALAVGYLATVNRQTTAGTTNQVMGYTTGTDDVALVYVAITEVLCTVAPTFTYSSGTQVTFNPTVPLNGAPTAAAGQGAGTPAVTVTNQGVGTCAISIKRATAAPTGIEDQWNTVNSAPASGTNSITTSYQTVCASVAQAGTCTVYMWSRVTASGSTPPATYGNTYTFQTA